MNAKQQIFVDAYVGIARLNASEAARIAGYVVAKKEGYRLKNDPEIAAAIRERMEQMTLAAPEVLQVLSDHAKGTLAYFLSETEDKETFIDLTSDVAKEHFHLLKKAKTKKRSGGKPEDRWEEIEIEIELHDPQSAAVHIGRHYKLFTDVREQSGPNGGPIEVNATVSEQAGTELEAWRKKMKDALSNTTSAPPIPLTSPMNTDA